MYLKRLENTNPVPFVAVSSSDCRQLRVAGVFGDDVRGI